MKTSDDATTTIHTSFDDDSTSNPPASNEPQIYPLGGPRPSSTPIILRANGKSRDHMQSFHFVFDTVHTDNGGCGSRDESFCTLT